MKNVTETSNAANAIATPISAVSGDKAWADMNTNERLVFLAKLCIMVCSGGFIFANLLADDIPPDDGPG